MDNNGKFLPPKTQAEVEERAKDISRAGAISILSSLKSRRAALVANIDEEIKFYEKVVELKDGE